MFSKYELIGIGASVLVMTVALYLIKLESASLLTAVSNSTQTAAVSESGLVAVDTSTGNASESLRSALLEAADSRGVITRLIANDVIIGTGDEVEKGDTVVVHYVGTLQNGQEFDNSKKRGQPYEFTVGANRVIAGWEEGIIGMKQGGTRILVIPAEKGYGDSGYGPIPPGATLVFSIELIEIK